MSGTEVLNKKINKFKQGERVQGFFLIKTLDLKTANANGKKYLDFTIGDKTGDISAKLWEVSEEVEKEITKNLIAKIRGTVVAWQGALQLKIERIRKASDEDHVDIDEYVQSAPLKSEIMYDAIHAYIDEMTNEDIKKLTAYMFEERKEKLLYYPAAKKNHHALKGGLLFHVYTMLRNAENLSNVYDFMNKDLLYAGVILHDLAKMDEMDSNELGIVNEYTLEGSLLGHITEGIKKLEVVGEKLGTDKNILMYLQHMILSHHYEPEYGSPIKPMIPEAELLHYLDVLDARMYDMRKAVNETEPGQFSERLWSLDNRRIYNHGEI